jgi:hypothetical protein
MLEYLLEKRTIRKFLTKYSQNKWNYVVPLLVELGIIFLKKHFNGPLNSIQLKEIVEDLKKYQNLKDSAMTGSGSTKRGESDEDLNIKESEENSLAESETKEKGKIKKSGLNKPVFRNNLNTRSNNHKRLHPKFSNRPLSANHIIFRKPSSDWRKGDDYISDRSISKMRGKSGNAGNF